MDQLVMAALVTKNDLGLYAAATGWSQITLPVMRGLIAVSMPFVSGSDEGNRLARVTRLMTLGIISVVVLGVGGILATLLLWGPLYGPEYSSALPAALVLVVASLLLQYNGLLGNILRSLNRPGLVTWIEAGILVFSTIALLGALQIQPVMGAAMVSLLTYTLAALVYGKQISTRLQIHTRRLFDFAGGVAMIHQIRQRLSR
jgi:O-antigen/teichoic acid export membrane protein